MEQYFVNKNISHNGKDYSKGAPIAPEAPGFSDLKNAGHLEVKPENGEAKVAAPPPPAPEAPKAEPKKMEHAEAHMRAHAKAQVPVSKKPRK